MTGASPVLQKAIDCSYCNINLNHFLFVIIILDKFNICLLPRNLPE